MPTSPEPTSPDATTSRPKPTAKPARSSSPWWDHTSIYEIYIRSFFDSDGDGIGDLPGIIARLDYLHELGVEALWITPFFGSPQADFGYDITDYFSVAPEYGTLADVDRLLEEAHARGLKVLFDLVLNHTSDRHPWFIESRSSRTNPRHDWYIWADGRGRHKPNNWRTGNLLRSVWRYAPERDQYYVASFLPGQPDLNWHNPDVRRVMLDVARFWLRRGVDGFRLDMFGSVVKDARLRSNPLRRWPRRVPGLPVPEIYRRRHDLHTEAGFALARELRAVCEEFGDPERLLVAEVEARPSLLRRYLGPDALSLAFQFDFLRFRYRAGYFRNRLLDIERDLPAPLQPCYVLSNHDRMRSCSRVGGDLRKSKVLAVLMLTLRGAATIYMGEEIGMTNRPIPLGQARDGQARTFAFLPDRVVRWLERALRETINRDEVRTPMQWDASANAGFCPEDVRPWLPVHENRRERSVAAQLEDSASLLSLHRELLRLRRDRPALRAGSVEVLSRMPAGVLGIARRSPTDQVAVYLNFEDRPRSIPCPPADSLLTTNPGTGLRNGRLWLEPQSAIVLARPAPQPS